MSRRFPVYRGHRRLRGSVIVFVLGIILLAAFLITRLMDRAAVELAAESKAARRAELREEAISALEASLAVLADQSAIDNGLHDPADGWGRPLTLLDYQPSEGCVAAVAVEDESAKLSLPQAGQEELTAYLEAIDCPATATDRAVDALLSWTRRDHVSLEGESREFDAAALPYKAPERALRSFEELRAIPALRELFFDEQGRWNELGQRFRAGASLFTFGATNANTAGLEALLARGVNPARIEAIETARRGRVAPGALFRSPADLNGLAGGKGADAGVGTEALCLHLAVDVRYGGRGYRLDAWVGRPGASVTSRVPEASSSSQPAGATRKVDAASVRNNPRKRLDYPFQILELRENDGN